MFESCLLKIVEQTEDSFRAVCSAFLTKRRWTLGSAQSIQERGEILCRLFTIRLGPYCQREGVLASLQHRRYVVKRISQ